MGQEPEYGYENEDKIRLEVILYVDQEGNKRPIKIRFMAEGNVFIRPIARVTHITRAASRKAGGVGVRYTCVIPNLGGKLEKTCYLFEDDGRWFMER